MFSVVTILNTVLLFYKITSMESFELCRTREVKNKVRKPVYGHTCIKISFGIFCCFVWWWYMTQQTLCQTTRASNICVISLTQKLAC